MPLIVIEGSDGSGKATQAALLAGRLARDGFDVLRLSFPDYGSGASAAARWYLDGHLGADASPYAAAIAFAFDRYSSYAAGAWRGHLERGGVVLADRYAESNCVHQGARMPEAERAGFARWLDDLEHVRLRLPRPDGVIYLSMPPGTSRVLLAGRHRPADLHESDSAYLARCHGLYERMAAERRWPAIRCCDPSGRLRTPDDIAADVLAAARAIMCRGTP